MPITTPVKRLKLENIVLSGTAFDVANIPAWANETNIQIFGLSTNGTQAPALRIGAGGSPAAAGYVSPSFKVATSNAITAQAISTDRFKISPINTAADIHTIQLQIKKISNFKYMYECNGYLDEATDAQFSAFGFVDLGANMDIIRLLTQNGTDVFDGGIMHVEFKE